MTFGYNIGDAWEHGSRDVEPNTSYGDGQVVFFTGSPATMRFASTHAQGRVLGLGGIKLETLREMIEGRN